VFEIAERNEVVYQFVLLGEDEAAIAKLFDELADDTQATRYDVLGTDGHRMRSLRYTSELELDGKRVAINLTSVASPVLSFSAEPLSTGELPALGLALVGIDGGLVLGASDAYDAVISDGVVAELDEASLDQLYGALNAALLVLSDDDEEDDDDDPRE
jgi:hypothetical protein